MGTKKGGGGKPPMESHKGTAKSNFDTLEKNVLSRQKLGQFVSNNELKEYKRLKRNGLGL